MASKKPEKKVAKPKKPNSKSRTRSSSNDASFRMTQNQRKFLIALAADDNLSIPDIQDACERFEEKPFVPSDALVHRYQEKVRGSQKKMMAQEVLAGAIPNLAKSVERVKRLITLAESLEADMMEKKRIWMEKTRSLGQWGVTTDQEFMSPLVKEYRGLLDDIAKETGGRDPKSFAAQFQQVREFSLPSDMIASEFSAIYKDIRARGHLEYLLRGGRGSTKSTFTGEMIVELIKNNPQVHALITRQVGNTLRDSVFAQVRWAISELGLNDEFKSTTNPLEIEYLPTGQKMYFRGGDDPIKIKSIKPPFGYIGILWFEELDQFRGPESVRNIEQSAVRGGDVAWIFKTFNPPRTASNWANKYAVTTKANRYTHFSNYLGLPEEYLKTLADEKTRGKAVPFEDMVEWQKDHAVPHAWLGKPWLDEADYLREVNLLSYLHEYGGIPVGHGGLVFENVELRAITDEQIAEFDHVMEGIDWGYFPDPFVWGRDHYDASRMTLYIFDEKVLRKTSNKLAWELLVKEKGVGPDTAMMIADSAEPKSVNDFKSYGANIRAAEKGAESVNYSMKWLQSLRKIVIDPVRCPLHAEEFTNYELDQDKNGDFISSYPDKNNHAIDRTRYSRNLIWRRRGL